MKHRKIVVLDGYAANPGDISWDPLRELAEVVIYERSRPEEVAKRIAGAEIILTNKVFIDRYLIENTPPYVMWGCWPPVTMWSTLKLPMSRELL